MFFRSVMPLKNGDIYCYVKRKVYIVKDSMIHNTDKTARVRYVNTSMLADTLHSSPFGRAIKFLWRLH